MKMNTCLRSAAAMLVGALVGAGVSNLIAKESSPPKVTVSDRAIDRSSQVVSFSPVVKKVAPSVVNIYSTRKIKVQPFNMPFLDEPMLRRFFGDQFGQGRGPS